MLKQPARKEMKILNQVNFPLEIRSKKYIKNKGPIIIHKSANVNTLIKSMETMVITLVIVQIPKSNGKIERNKRVINLVLINFLISIPTKAKKTIATPRGTKTDKFNYQTPSLTIKTDNQLSVF